MIEHKDTLLAKFWSYLDRPAFPRRRASDASSCKNAPAADIGLDSLQASYFCKTIGVLLSKYPIEVYVFYRNKSTVD